MIEIPSLSYYSSVERKRIHVLIVPEQFPGPLTGLSLVLTTKMSQSTRHPALGILAAVYPLPQRSRRREHLKGVEQLFPRCHNSPIAAVRPPRRESFLYHSSTSQAYYPRASEPVLYSRDRQRAVRAHRQSRDRQSLPSGILVVSARIFPTMCISVISMGPRLHSENNSNS